MSIPHSYAANITHSAVLRLRGDMHLSQGGAWRDWDDSSTTASTAQNPDQAPDERATNALHTMQDHLQQTTVISQRLAQKMLSEQSASKTMGNAACEDMESATHARTR